MANVDGTSADLFGLAAIDASCAEHSGCYQNLLVTDKEKCIKQTLKYITVRFFFGRHFPTFRRNATSCTRRTESSTVPLCQPQE